MKVITRELLNEYRQADFTRRLHMYLQFPDMRAEFADLEKRGTQPAQCRYGCKSESRRDAVLNPKPGILKRLFSMTRNRRRFCCAPKGNL